MGLIATCLRGIYHRLGPYFNRRIQVQPATSRKDTSQESLCEERPLTVNPFVTHNDHHLEEEQWNTWCDKAAETYKQSVPTAVCTDPQYAIVYCCLIANWNDFNHVNKLTD